MKVHPGVVASGSHLAASVPISKGTPLIGVLSDMYLDEKLVPSDTAGASPVIDIGPDGTPTIAPSAAEAECQGLVAAVAEPKLWPFRLAVRLLKEMNDAASPWQAYVGSLAPRPAAPLLWSVEQANELQYIPTKRAVRDQLVEFRRFYDTHFGGRTVLGSSIDVVGLASLVASASARGIEVETGRWVLMPLIDLVSPPEAFPQATGGAAAPPSCELTVEGNREDGLTALVAARDLAPGEPLTRDRALSADDLLLRHGLVAMNEPRDDVLIWAGISKDSAKQWQLREIKRAVTTEPDLANGDVVVRGCVRRSKKISEAIDQNLMYSARVLAHKKEEDLLGVGEWSRDRADSVQGLQGLSTELRRTCLIVLVEAVKAYKSTFPTSEEQDAGMLATVDGNMRAAVAYRLSKKRVLSDVLKVLGSAQDREVERRSQRKEARSSGLPAAVTGMKQPASHRGFGKAPTPTAAAQPAARVAATASSVAAGARVKVSAGKYKGRVGRVTRAPDGTGMVALKLDSGEDVDFVNVAHCRECSS